MSKSKVKTKINKVTGGRIAVMVISMLLLSVIMAFGMLLGISSFKFNGPLLVENDFTTYRKRVPAEGALPTNSQPIDNIGYMAYTLDNQPFYHVYAHNSTKSTGYEQVTQSWKDYKNAELSGADMSVMVCSDLSYSALVKSASQSCFIGNNEAHIRSGNKPAKESKPLDIEWSTGKPAIYSKETYKTEYGEFSTEISVYVINAETLIGADEVVDNGDGTYTQKFYLNETAGCWYQYGMKTRGGLKDYPQFKKIEIEFTFDANWRILQSFCTERAMIAPRALGGMNMESTSKTTTTYDYSEEGFDGAHFDYYDKYFKNYKGSVPDDSSSATVEYGVLDVLGNGFGKVLDPASGQQFKLALTLGDTVYDGKVFAKLGDMNDVLNTLDVRAALEKRGSGRQDFYAEFKSGKINVYFGSDFAMNADIDGISQSVGKLTEWIKGLNAQPAQAVRFALTEEETGGGLDLDALMKEFKLELTETSATVSLKSEDLLGLGVGVDVALGFDRIKQDDGDAFSIKSIQLNDIKYKGETINLKAEIVPDDGEVITREAATTPANLSDYIDSIYEVLTSNTIEVNIGLADKLIAGLTLDACAHLTVGSTVAANVRVDAQYNSLSLSLDASYVLAGSKYGKLYLHVTEVCGKAVDAKVYCDIADTVDTVKELLALFGGNAGVTAVDAADKATLAETVNKVLSLNFSQIIGKVQGDENSISLEINVDNLLKGLGVSAGMDLGTLSFAIDRANGVISGELPALGVSLNVQGSQAELPLIGDTADYVDVNVYLESAVTLLKSPSFDISVEFAGKKINDNLDLSGLNLTATATAAIEGKLLRVALPAEVEYNGYSLALTAYYAVNLDGGDWGDIYLNITKINGTAVNAKVSCNVKSAADTVKGIIGKFTAINGGAAASVGEQDVLSKAVEVLLSLDFNEVINATNERLRVTLDVDALLSGLDISLGGMEFGELQLEYTPVSSTLSGKLETLGLQVTVCGNANELAEFNTSNYVNLNTYLDSLNALLNAPAYDVTIELTGKKLNDNLDLSGLNLTATATAAIEGKLLRVALPAEVEYNGYSLALTAYYAIDLDGGNYGDIYLNITKINGTAVDAKVCCNVSEAVDGMTELIAKFKPKTVSAAAEGESADVLSKAIEVLLSLDFNEVINATNEKLCVMLDIDGLLSGLDISLGGMEFGELQLEYTPVSSTLSGKLETLGLQVTVCGNANELAAFVTSNYVNLNTYLDSVNALLDAPAYDVTIELTGKKINDNLDLSGLNLSAKATAAIEGKLIRVALPAEVEYNGYSLALTAYYSIDLDSGDWGKVYLNVTKLKLSAEKEIDLDVKVYCDIKYVADSITGIIDKFKPKTESVAAASEEQDVLSKAIEVLLGLDFNEVINATNEKLCVTLDVDALLSGLEISLGGMEFGELQLEYTPATSALSGKLETLGLEVELCGNADGLAGFVTSNYVDLAKYLDGVTALLNKNSYVVELSFAGNNAISPKVDLTGLTLDMTARVAPNEGYGGLGVDIGALKVRYKELSVELTARYEINFNGDWGTVYLHVISINKTAVDAKISLNIKDAADKITQVIERFVNSDGEKEKTDVVGNLISGALSLDFNSLITVTDKKAEVNLDLDKLLSKFNLGLKLGTLNLEFDAASYELSGSDETVGLKKLSVSGSDEKLPSFNAEGYIDANSFIDGIADLALSSVYKVGLNFSGTKIGKVDLDGLVLDGAAYVKLENGYESVSANVPLHVNYCGLDVALTLYYSLDITAKDYGTVYINLTRINDVTFNARAYCDVKDAVGAIKGLIDSFAPSANAQSSASGDVIAKLVGVALNLDYPAIIRGTKNSLSVTLDLDDILHQLEIDLGGISLGVLPLEIKLSGSKAVLSGSLISVGLTQISVSGADNYAFPAAPEKDDCLDATQLINLIKDMVAEGKNIAQAKDAAFTLSLVTEDGVAVSGFGEVGWTANEVKVALSLELKKGGQTLELNFVYDQTKSGDEPFIILTINGDGVKITRGETDLLVNSIKGLITAFAKDGESGSDYAAPAAGGYALSVGDREIDDILSNANVKKMLSKILSFASEFTVQLKNAENAQDVYELLLTHIDGVRVTLGADGKLSLGVGADGAFSIEASVKAGGGEALAEIVNKLSDEKSETSPDGKYTYYELSAFVRTVYGKFFDKWDETSLKDVLGEVYIVNIALDGAKSDFAAMEGVRVNAELYYDEGVVGLQRTTKLLQTRLTLDINGTKAEANVTYSGRNIYMELARVGTTSLTGIKFFASVDSIFDVAEQFVRFITDTDFVDVVRSITGKGVSQTDRQNISTFNGLDGGSQSGEPSALTKLLDALLSFDIDSSIKYDANGNTLSFNVDCFAKALFNAEIGTVTATLDADAKTLSADVKRGGAAWLTLDAYGCNCSKHASSAEADGACIRREKTLVVTEYKDINFISTLVYDLVKTATAADKSVHKLFSFTGSTLNSNNISVNVNVSVINININLKNTTLTVGFDENNKFYFSLAATLQAESLVVTLCRNWDISVTYCDGLLVLGRQIGTADEEYKVLTFNYLLDNLLDKNNSPISWLIGANDTAWGLLADNLKLDIGSGLTKPKVYSLFEELSKGATSVDLGAYISGMTVKAGDSVTNVFGSGAPDAINQFGFTGEDDYYAFEIAADKLIGGATDKLYAAILRNDETGISGIKAYARIKDMITVTVDFGKYLDEVTEVYGGKVLTPAAAVTQDNFFDGYTQVDISAVNEENYSNYFVYDGENYVQAEEYNANETYYLKVNTRYYILSNGKYVLATEFDENATYYAYTDSTASLGTVAVGNYLNHVTEKFGFDKNKQFESDGSYVNQIFGCFNTANGQYLTSDVLQTIYLDVYSAVGQSTPEKTVEVLYGSTVNLISDFPEFADEANSTKLVYVTDGNVRLPNSIIIGERLSGTVAGDDAVILPVSVDGRVSIFKSSVGGAIKVVFDLGSDRGERTAALFEGEQLSEYPVGGYSFLGWYKTANFKGAVETVNTEDVDEGVIKLYGKYVQSEVSKDGVVYSFDVANDCYFVSGTNSEISRYYGADKWLKIEAYIDGYAVGYIGREAFSLENKTDADKLSCSLVNVLIPETVKAIYDKAFFDNRGLRNVVILSDSIFFGGRADGTSPEKKTSAFYGCYLEGDVQNKVNVNFTVYFNSLIHTNPYAVSTTNNALDPAWHRIFFKKSSNTYSMNTQAVGWAYAETNYTVNKLAGSETQLPSDEQLNKLLSTGVKTQTSIQELERAIEEKLKQLLGKDIFEVTVSGAGYSLNGKKHTLSIVLDEHAPARDDITAITFTVRFGGNVLVNAVEKTDIAIGTDLYGYYTQANFACAEQYALVNWYTNENCTKLAPEMSGSVSALYGVAVPRSYTDESGVVYGFDTTEKCYFVSGSDAEKISPYRGESGKDKWLKISESIFGFDVKYIAQDAFSLISNPEAEKLSMSLVNVLVPATVQAVYERAFFDNKGLRNVVFLADKVFFGGSANKNGINTAFAWCFTDSDVVDNVNVNLTVSYTGVWDVNPFGVTCANSAIDADWNRIYFATGKYLWDPDIIYTLKTSASGWQFADMEVEADDEYSYLKDIYLPYLGLSSVTDSDEQVAENAIAEINSLTSSRHFFIDGFDVAVSYRSESRKRVLVLTLTRRAHGAKYAVSYTGNALIENLIGYNGGLYAVEGQTYSIKPAEGYVISSVSGVEASVGENESTFVMPQRKVEVSVSCNTKPITVTLISDIEFTVEGKTTDTVTLQGGAPIPEAEAEGYAFLGWAYQAEDTKLYFESTVSHSTYYAIWAYLRTELETVESAVCEGGITLTAKIKGDSADSVYGWYTDSNFDGEPFVCTNNVTTVPDGLTAKILYSKLVFNVNYSLTSDLGGTNTYFVSEAADPSKTSDSSGKIKILEGTHSYSWKDGDSGNVLRLDFTDEKCNAKTLYFRMKNKPKYSIYNNTIKDIKVTVTLPDGSVYTQTDIPTNASALIVNGNISLSITN